MQKEARAINDELFVEALAAFKRYCGTTNKEATNMQMSEEMAVRLHRMMWSDMQRELGDNPGAEERIEYKVRWVKKHFPGAVVQSNCFLCEFTHTPHSGAIQCTDCPIRWPNSSCTTEAMHYQSAPISKILSLPVKNGYLARLDDAKVVVDSCSYYKFREDMLSKASGIPASSAIGDHVKAIQENAIQQSTFSKLYGDTKMELAKASGHPAADGTIAHIKAIQEKAVEEYFEKNPGAKLATMDVDQAFKQYADEQKAPIFHALAEASGLDRNRPVDDHIREIMKNSMEAGAAEERDRIQEKIYEVILS